MSDFSDMASQQERQDSETSTHNDDISSVFSDTSFDMSDSDSPSSDDCEEEIYFDLSKIDESSETDPQEYEDLVDFDFYQKHIARKIKVQNRPKVSQLKCRKAKESQGEKKLAFCSV